MRVGPLAGPSRTESIGCSNNGLMRVFVSSVRVSLEQERDSLKGLIMALGHEPVMFEDFTAQPVPSREACLEGVRSCAAYVTAATGNCPETAK